MEINTVSLKKQKQKTESYRSINQAKHIISNKTNYISCRDKAASINIQRTIQLIQQMDRNDRQQLQGNQFDTNFGRMDTKSVVFVEWRTQ